MSDARVRERVEMQYVETAKRLEGDPEWVQLCAAADKEAEETPEWWVARNRKAIHLELHTPISPKGEDT